MSDNSSTEITNQASGAAAEPTPVVPTRLRYRAAFQQVLPEAQALDLKDLLVINIDVTTAVTTAIGALPEIMALRERASRLAEFDIKRFDDLGTYALATMHVQGEYVAATTPPEVLLALNDDGVALRETLHSDATALAKRGLINGTPLADFKTGPGYKILAEDLVGISSLLRHSWDAIASKSALTMEELDRAEELSDKLLSAVGAREQAPAVLAEVALQRQRVFTLFVEAYDQARRAINFLRWTEGDLETIAPSLYSGRGNTRRKSEPGQPATPPAPAPTTPGTTAPAPTPVGTAPTQTPPVATGLPGSSPFAVG